MIDRTFPLVAIREYLASPGGDSNDTTEGVRAMTTVESTQPSAAPTANGGNFRRHDGHPLLALILSRLLGGALTLFVVSVIVFLATSVLPGNAAYAVLGREATPQRLKALEEQLHLNESVPAQYWHWFSGLLRADLGDSLVNQQSVWHLLEPCLINSAFLVVIAAVLGTIIGFVGGVASALTRDSWFDKVSSLVSLAAISLPEFVIGIALIMFLSTSVFHFLPAVAVLPPGTFAWSAPNQLVLPVATLVVVVVPYIWRMTRAATIEAMESDCVEMATLKGLTRRRAVIVHALPHAIPPTIQVVGLVLLYLSGGIVIVEQLFNFPGVGQALVQAVNSRDIPVIQFIVVLLAAVYIVVNIATDVIALMVSPRRRFRR